jgi:hypothetical protein
MTLLLPADIRQDPDRRHGTFTPEPPLGPNAQLDSVAMGGSTHPPEPNEERLRVPGEHVVLREIWNGRVWFARPAIVVEDTPNMTTFHIPTGIRYQRPVDDEGTDLRLYTDEWRMDEALWETPEFVVSFAFPDTPYAVILGYDTEGSLREYYVNLESPLVRTEIGFDTVEHLLDVEIPPDRSTWSWKDEGELEEAVERGLFTEEDATWFRYWGERAVEHVLLREPPFDQDWSTWSPDPSWETPELPAGWDLVTA